jgi:hypothetical protein
MKLGKHVYCEKAPHPQYLGGAPSGQGCARDRRCHADGEHGPFRRRDPAHLRVALGRGYWHGARGACLGRRRAMDHPAGTAARNTTGAGRPGLGIVARPSSDAPVSSRLPAQHLEGLVGVWGWQPRRHGLPQPRPRDPARGRRQRDLFSRRSGRDQLRGLGWCTAVITTLFARELPTAAAGLAALERTHP